jgi:hypothetical protein
MPSISIYRVRSIVSYRRKKGLCGSCGAFPSGQQHKCIENYIKTDMVGVEIDKNDPYVVCDGDANISNYTDKIKEEVRRKTVVSYREKKNLCLRCGNDITDLCNQTSCEENYDIADRRQNKEEDPRTIITPKKKEPSILDSMQLNILNKEYLKYSNDEFLKIEPTNIMVAVRNFIIIDINHSEFNQRIDFSYVNFMIRKHCNYIIYLLGDPIKIFPYSDILKLRKMVGVCLIRNVLDQNIVNHICGCKRFFGFPSRYSTYCMLHKIPVTIFFKNDEGFELPCNTVNLDKNQNVDIELIKKNIVSWRI